MMSCWPWFERSVAPQPCMLNDMASVEQQSLAATAAAANEFKGIPKSKRKLQKHLRSAGLAYVSRTGKVIPAKRVAEELCQCPHKCDDLVPMEARQQLFQHFYGLGEADLQNQFLRKNMDLRARNNVPESTGSGRPPRRITCKYLVPLLDEDRCVEVCQKAFVSAFVITTKRVRLQREKLIASLGLNSYRSHNRSKRDNSNVSDFSSDNNNDSLTLNNNTITLNNLKTKYLSVAPPSGGYQNKKYFADRLTTDTNSSAKRLASILGKKSLEQLKELNITMEKESSTDSDMEDADNRPPATKRSRSIREQRECASNDNPLLPYGLIVPEGVTIAPVMAPGNDHDMAIVHNFFRHQLWKPEYIGAA
ncbi:uncharacterized protein LOC143203528 isoform X2 [Rhynchophorus ferrugineus]|uniref:uncharacterized protein LOC143203528 isoform X2 n=1 Tax=Rhynchophorus ferrugineus TaxID=354439 RepID=UPI003FCD453C